MIKVRRGVGYFEGNFFGWPVAISIEALGLGDLDLVYPGHCEEVEQQVLPPCFARPQGWRPDYNGKVKRV